MEDVLLQILGRLWPLALLLAVLGGAAVLAKRVLADQAGESQGEKPWPYTTRSVLTKTEHSFFESLLVAFPEHRVLAQVSMSSLIRPTARKEFMSWFGRISQKSFDYVLCTTEDSTPLLAIELDDPTHERADRKKADATKDRVCRDAGLPLLRFHVKRMPDVEQLRTRVEEVLGRPAAEVTYDASPQQTAAVDQVRAGSRRKSLHH